MEEPLPTHKQRIESGELVDVRAVAPEMLEELGIEGEVAVEAGLWEEVIEPSTAREEQGETVEKRLWDTLWMFSLEARKARGAHVLFVVYHPPNDSGDLPERPYELMASVETGEGGEPVVTISYPWR